MKRCLNLIFSALVIFAITYISNVEGLTVKFRKVTEDYVRSGGHVPIGAPPGTTVPVYADEGWKFVKLKITLKNEGNTDCVFDFAEVYLSTEQDSLYRSLESATYFTSTKTKIKPGKEIKKTLLFEFPDGSSPKELFIEDKRFAVVKD